MYEFFGVLCFVAGPAESLADCVGGDLRFVEGISPYRMDSRENAGSKIDVSEKGVCGKTTMLRMRRSILLRRLTQRRGCQGRQLAETGSQKDRI